MEKVFSIYNSFRKESSDATHLSEFQHIEFEGKIGAEENIRVFTELFESIAQYLFKNCEASLKYFLSNEQFEEKKRIVLKKPTRISFFDALKKLYEDTGDSKYATFSLKHFGTWEEVRLTEIM